MNKSKLSGLYTDFSRIDLDSHGGYARVAQVKTQTQGGNTEFRAFKLMRHEIEYQEGIKRFVDELRILIQIGNDPYSPSAITKVYDCGFVPAELSRNLHDRETPDSSMQVISMDLDIQNFIEVNSALCETEPEKWLPYLVVELAPFDDSLLRQIRQQPIDDALGIFRLPSGELIAMAMQLLDVMNYLHLSQRRAYIDWKPEHIFWDAFNNKVKLVDWNVTIPLDDDPGEKQNIRNDLRLFCGAVLYIGSTFIDPDDHSKPIGPRPTTDIGSPIPEILRRYWTDKPEFYQRDATLTNQFKQIIGRGLDPAQGYDSIEDLKIILLQYARQELGWDGVLPSDLGQNSPYFQALMRMRMAQQQLLQAQKELISATELNGGSLEFTQLFDTIRQALINIPGS
jgi:hypothetical protein